MNKFTLSNFNHGGVMLNVSGERDSDDCWITKITAADSQIDISDLFSERAIELMAFAVDAQLDREARTHNAEARAERHQWHKEFAITA